uniref:PX domain-containing protein n=1 Tax=Spumella elongata TaxID=89044 RepID=A0A7S3HR13_9STRA|mmetsp:Transcript_64152/g.113326  ORF Transcript_64152/g.113326 Transcript_64152/m.113326 type:complete len:457 (+) Transcript_64152:23-1393(+)
MASSALASHGKSSGKTRRRVKFNRDTIFNDSDHIALTITRHSFIYDKGYTQYFIKLLCRGVEWTLHKRYRDFYNLHHELIKENQNYNIDLPKLPEKRWFERQRWINRADEKYGWIRRIQLQDYLRAIVKIRVLRNESLSFWKFICMPKRAMIAPSAADEERERENSRSMSMDSRQGSAKPSSNAAVGGLTPQEFKTLRGKLPGAASSAHSTAPGLEPEAAVETDILLDPEADVETEGYNLEEDLEKFNESTELAAREAVLRGLYGSKSPVADVDNIGKPDPNLASPGALKLSKVFDDDGEEMTQAPEGGSADLSYIAVNNAALNNRLTSKDAFASPSTARTPITQVNKMWSGTEIAAALDAINAEEFDTALHFSGPSVSESPTLSIASTSSSVQAPRGEKHGSFSDGRKTLNGSKGHQALSAHAIPPPNGANLNPPVPPAGTEDKKRRGSQTKTSK